MESFINQLRISPPNFVAESITKLHICTCFWSQSRCCITNQINECKSPICVAKLYIIARNCSVAYAKRTIHTKFMNEWNVSKAFLIRIEYATLSFDQHTMPICRIEVDATLIYRTSRKLYTAPVYSTRQGMKHTCAITRQLWVSTCFESKKIKSPEIVIALEREKMRYDHFSS